MKEIYYEKVAGAAYAIKMALVALCECIDGNIYDWPTDDQVYPRLTLSGDVDGPYESEADLAA